MKPTLTVLAVALWLGLAACPAWADDEGAEPAPPATPTHPAPGAPTAQQRFDTMAAPFDLDKDGTITWDEYLKVLTGFAAHDTNGDGVITKDDLLDLPAAGHPAWPGHAAPHGMSPMGLSPMGLSPMGVPAPHGMPGGGGSPARVYGPFVMPGHGGPTGHPGMPGHGWPMGQQAMPGHGWPMGPQAMPGHGWPMGPQAMPGHGLPGVHGQVFGPFALPGHGAPPGGAHGTMLREAPVPPNPPRAPQPPAGAVTVMPGGHDSSVMAFLVLGHKADTDADRKVSKAEWTALVKGLKQDEKGHLAADAFDGLFPPMPVGAPGLETLFDSDQDGAVTPADLDALFDHVDANDDGVIEPREMIPAGMGMPPGMPRRPAPPQGAPR